MRVRGLQAALFLTAILAFWAFAWLSLSLGANSRTAGEASPALEARDLAQGNVFLSGWVVNHDSFYTSYVPFGAALIRLFGYSPVIIPVGSFFTGTLLLAGAFLVAGRRGVSRGSIAVVLFLFLGLLTPFQSGILFFFMGPTATIAYALFALAALREALVSKRPRRRAFWFFLFGVMVLVAAVGDPFGDHFFVLPLLAAAIVVALRTGGSKTRLAVAATAIGGIGLSLLAGHFMRRGFSLAPAPASLGDYFAPSGRWAANFRIYRESLEALMVVSLPGWPVASVMLTVLRLVAAAAAILLTVKLLFSRPVLNRTSYFLDAILLLGILENHAEFLVCSPRVDLAGARNLFPGVVFLAILPGGATVGAGA